MYSQIIRIREHLLAIRNLKTTFIINDISICTHFFRHLFFFKNLNIYSMKIIMPTKFGELYPNSNQITVTYLHKLMFIYSLTLVLEQKD